MNRQVTQFAIALVLSLGLASATVAAVVAEVTGNGRSELTLALVAGLVAANSQAIAFLFRTNNTPGSQ